MALLAFFGLWETTLLAGATAVSVPVVIHLLNRRRYRIVTWAAMRFLLMAQKQNSRQMRSSSLAPVVPDGADPVRPARHGQPLPPGRKTSGRFSGPMPPA